MTRSSRVLMVDDEEVVRNTYRTLLENNPDFVLVGEASNGRESIQAYEMLQPDLVLMDLQMPHMSGIAAIEQICSRWPEACVVALTTFDSNDYIIGALKAGASGYLLKDAAAKSLVSSLYQALAGEMPLSASIRRALVTSVVDERNSECLEHPLINLTNRELEVLAWLAHGLTNHQIGNRMHVSEGTIKQYLFHIGRKLHANSRTQILVKSIRLNLIDPFQIDE